jgi:hypothetical protein
MTSYRPPLGGLFRLSGPAPRDAGRPDRAEEARDAIRHFVRVLERLDRDVAASPRPRPKTTRSKGR